MLVFSFFVLDSHNMVSVDQGAINFHEHVIFLIEKCVTLELNFHFFSMTTCPLCKNEINTHSDRFIFQNEYVTVIENLNPYYPKKQHQQFLIMPNQHIANYQDLLVETKMAILEAKQYLLREYGGSDFIAGTNSGPTSGASIPEHYHQHFTIIEQECSVCLQIRQRQGVVQEYDTVVILKNQTKTASWYQCYLIALKRHTAHLLDYTDEEINDLIQAETDLRKKIQEHPSQKFPSLNTLENYGPQTYFDTPVLAKDEVTSCQHSFIRMVTRTGNPGGGIGFGSMTNVKFHSHTMQEYENQII